jgi:hypothetical protein
MLGGYLQHKSGAMRTPENGSNANFYEKAIPVKPADVAALTVIQKA